MDSIHQNDLRDFEMPFVSSNKFLRDLNKITWIRLGDIL